MLNRDFRPRLDFGTIQTNVIMTQIRAEKQKTSIKIIQPLLTSAKESTGKRHFQRDLYKITDITNLVNNQESRSPSRSTGKKIINKSQSMKHIETPSRSQGKKQFDQKFKRTTLLPLENKCKRPQTTKINFGRRRIDHSPVNQQRQSNYSPLKWNQN